MTRNGTGPASASRKLSGDGDVGIYQTPATWLWLAVLHKVNVGTVTTRRLYRLTSSNEREAVTVSGESSEYGDVETCRMPGWLSQYEKGTREMIRASMSSTGNSGVWRGDESNESTHGRTKVEFPSILPAPSLLQHQTHCLLYLGPSPTTICELVTTPDR
ncbi:hypothetical protein D6D15_09074 [Aureobasidium pullulans]|uniref:Uncharacterized protein n=1 Tax=Aureobasidium pullulans TaxID=5580 RepID=A0A4S9AWF1_AURPU|nr:hypothetical protein D6D15_09074 [Aureobasidium pullulans]